MLFREIVAYPGENPINVLQTVESVQRCRSKSDPSFINLYCILMLINNNLR